jgi:hypothetical protein
MATTQAQSLTQNWKKLANATDYAWFTNDNNVTTLAFNPVTNKLLVAKRADRIFVINPTTGAQEDTLKTTGAAIGTEGLKYNKIRVAADGAIYALSLQTGAGTARIYRWASQADTATLCATFAVTERCGDAFGLAGTGATTVLYASGAGATNNAFNIYILNTTDGKSFNLESTVNMTSAPTAGQQWSNRVVEPAGVGVNSDIWIKGGGFIARKLKLSAKDAMNIRTATVATSVDDGTGIGQASIGYGGMRLFTTSNNNRFLVLAGGNNQYAATKTTVLNITVDTSKTTYGVDSLNTQANYITNANGTGDVSLKDNGNGTFTVFSLSTNNGMSAVTTRNVTPVKDIKSVVKGFTVQTLENPMTETVKFQINASSDKKMTVNIVNTLGSIVVTKQVAVNVGLNTISLPTTATGLLFIVVNDGVNEQTVKVIKQ